MRVVDNQGLWIGGTRGCENVYRGVQKDKGFPKGLEV